MENEVRKIPLNQLVYYMQLFKTDLQHIHWHAAGEDFDKIHTISEELYKEAEKQIDDLAELAIADFLEVVNLTEVLNVVDDYWDRKLDEVVDWPDFVNFLYDKGNRIIDYIRSVDTEHSDLYIKHYLEDILTYWEKTIYYKNNSRLVLTHPGE